MLGYEPIQAYGNYNDGMMSGAAMAPLMSQMPSFDARQLPSPPPLAPRKPADQLYKMYQAWEQTKTSSGEIQEQYMASRYYNGKQWTDAEIKELKRRKQPVTTKNRVKRKVDFLVGVEQRLRRDPKCYPRTPVAEQAAYVGTAALRSVEDETKWPAVASDTSNEAMVRGIGAIWQGAKVIKGEAKVCKHKVPSDRFFYDPCSELWNFADARYLGEWQWIDMDEAIEMLPFATERIETLARARADGSLSMVPQEFGKINTWADWVDSERRRIRLISIWYKYRGVWMFDYLVGSISLCPEDYDCKSPYMGEEEETDHPYQAWSPYVDEQGNRYGVVRDMIPVQDEINKRTSKMLYMLTVRQTQGEKGAIDDVDKMKMESAKPDGHIEYNKGFDFAFVDQTAQTQGQFELLQEAKAEIENLGPNPGLVGRGVEKQSGRAILAQQNSGMTELSPVFERMREWKLSVYHKDWRLIRQFWTNERYIRVTADPKAVEFLSINRIVEDPMTGQVKVENAIAEMDVDVILDEGPDTVTMREELLAQLSDSGAVPPEILIELSSLPEKDVVLKRLQELKEPPAELVAMQDKLAKIELALKASQVDESVAKVESTRAGVIKTLVESGAPRQVISSAFPIHYREPTFLDRIQAAARGIAAQEQQGPPQNAMMAGAGPEGQMPPGGQPNALAAPPRVTDPMMEGEPQLNQPGGLPLGPGVEAPAQA